MQNAALYNNIIGKLTPHGKRVGFTSRSMFGRAKKKRDETTPSTVDEEAAPAIDTGREH